MKFYKSGIFSFLPFSSQILLCRWARRGDVWEAEDLMKQMKEDGVPPNIHTYTSYINACCKAGDMQVREFCIGILSFLLIVSCNRVVEIA